MPESSPRCRIPKQITRAVVFAAFGLWPAISFAHDDTLHCEAVADSVVDAGFGDVVLVTCAARNAILSSNTYPDHPMMTGIIGTNEQVPVPAANYASPISLQPTLGTEPQTRDAALGVAVNGVPIYEVPLDL